MEDIKNLPDPPPQHGRMHERWAALGLPSAGISFILDESDEHGFYANYVASSSGHSRGYTEAQLLDLLSKRIEAIGFRHVCTAFEGHLRGFARGTDELAVKVYDLGDEIAVSVFDSQGEDKLMLGVCMGRYTLGAPVRIK